MFIELHKLLINNSKQIIGSIGAHCYKSTPWGGVNELMPYMSRRATENHTALESARNEVPYYVKELKQRTLSRKHV